jgi:hypothetical protein
MVDSEPVQIGDKILFANSADIGFEVLNIHDFDKKFVPWQNVFVMFLFHPEGVKTMNREDWKVFDIEAKLVLGN